MILAVLVQGPYLVRGASLSGSKLAVTGDIVNATTLEIFAPKAVKSITWNGKALHTQRTEYGSLKGSIAAPKTVTLPSFKSWKSKDSLPERLTDYDDSGAAWVGKNCLFLTCPIIRRLIVLLDANHQSTLNPRTPTTLPVMYADEYGKHFLQCTL